MNMAWIPLESNPEVMTKFLHTVGVPDSWSIVDVYGLDPDLLIMVPKPVLAVILLYPLSAEGQPFDKTEDKDTKTAEDETSPPGSVYHIKQYIENACGTIALIHAIANNRETINLKDGFLKKFLDETKDLSFTKRGEHLINAENITEVHCEVAHEGQTLVPCQDTPVNYHFVAFVHKDGSLYELDGRKPAPINHGSTSAETLLEDAARVCKEYMSRDPEEMRFTVVALAATD